MKQFKTGVIGVGFIGAVHIEALRRLGNVTVTALCSDVNNQALAEKFCVPKAYDDYRRMIDECELDFVHICTPNQTHFAIASYAQPTECMWFARNRWQSAWRRRGS